MNTISMLDLVGLALFFGAWFAYHLAVESTFLGERSLNGLMHRFRRDWMAEMLTREVRIVDTQIMASLQNGTAFFASTSLFAIGGALAVLRATDDVLKVFSDLPLGLDTSRALWEVKVSGLVVIFVYAFFKFAWAYRLFNYAAILIGAAPPFEESMTAKARRYADCIAEIVTDAGRQFNRGQRAFFFALAYVGWFVSPLVLILTTAAALGVMVQRQFRSYSHRAVAELADHAAQD